MAWGKRVNIAIATGVGSFHAVDMNVTETPPELLALHTTTVRTHRGHHLYLTHVGQPPLKSARLELFGMDVEFRGFGQSVYSTTIDIQF